MNATHENEPIVYEIDGNDVIVYVDAHWDPFAQSNGAPDLVAERVVGEPLYRFVEDDRVKHLYSLLFAQVRRQQTPI